jgi:uncharacterized protein YegP (UPF0339 family)
MSSEKIAKYRVEKNKAGKWFWHEIAGNGQKISTAGQSFATKASAKRACENARAKAGSAPIEIREG